MWNHRLNQLARQCDLAGNPIEVIGWSYQMYLPSNVPHRHSYFEACLVGEHGQGRFESDDQSHILGPGTFFVARPGQIHQIVNTASPDMELFWLSFTYSQTGSHSRGEHSGGEITNLLRDFTTSSVAVRPEQTHLLTQWNALRAVAQHPSRPGDELALKCLSQALILGIVQAGAEIGPPPELNLGSETLQISSCVGTAHSEFNLSAHHAQLVRLGVRYINDNLERSLSIEEICRYLGISRRQISRVFAAYTGLTPAAYIERTRLDRAEALLRHGQKSVKEVAHAVGYPDVHHFTRSFTRVVGTPPGEYRARGGARTPRLSGPNIQIPGSLV